MHPTLFTVFGFPVRSFGVAMVVAFALSLALARRRGPRFGISKEAVGDMAFWTILAGVLGARLFFLAQEWKHYAAHPSELLTLRFEGLTSFGGLLCGMAAAMAWAYRKRVPVRNLLDAVAPAFLVGHIVGRVGCLLNGCCFGGVCPADTPWGIHVAGSPVLHHPAQVYDSWMNLAALGLVLAVERARPLKAGAVTGLVIALHGVARCVYEFWRAGTEAQVAAGEASSTYWGTLPFTQAQAMAFALVLLGAALMLFSHRRAPLPTGNDDLSGVQPVS